MNNSKKLTEDRAVAITEQLACSPPEDDDWEFVSMSNLGGEFRIEAVALGGEPHFVRVRLRVVRGRLKTSVVCCPHLEDLVEGILMDGSSEREKTPVKMGIRSRARQ
jgi:hypothetical protein